MKGLVYFIMSKNNGDIKIGYDTSESGIERFNTLKTGASRGLEYLAYIKSDSCEMLEKDLHEKFKPKRLNGEWFEIGMQDVVSVVNEYGGKFGMPAELNLPDTESKEKLRQYKKAKARFLRMLPYRFSLSDIELFGQPYYYKNFGLTLSQAKDIIEKNLVARKEGRSIVICNDKNDPWQKSLDWPFGTKNSTQLKNIIADKTGYYYGDFCTNISGEINRHENLKMLGDLQRIESQLMENSFVYELYLKNLYDAIQNVTVDKEEFLLSVLIEDAFIKTSQRFRQYFNLVNNAERAYDNTSSSNGITGRNYDVLIKIILIFRKLRDSAISEAKEIGKELKGVDLKHLHSQISGYLFENFSGSKGTVYFELTELYIERYNKNFEKFFES
jgi:hypothetical protein